MISERILDHIKVLSSDAFEGRKPGTEGEERTIAYLLGEFRRLGLAPGNPDGSHLQEVPLVGITSKTRAFFEAPGGRLDPAWIDDYIALSRRLAPSVEVGGSEIVFAGYGVAAPEHGWDDFKGADVRGKTLVVLVNDPGFAGKAMTYHGRWTCKFEEASARGAAACLIVHETGPAGYPYSVVTTNWARENFDLESADGNAGRIAVEGWLSLEGAKKLFSAAGLDWARLKDSARRRDFRPVSLGMKANFSIANAARKFASRNVLGRLAGSDPGAAAESVVYVAHWDHLGRDPERKGDPIFHGAADNAFGTALLLEIARSFALLPPARRPRRSVLFLAVTAEEMGLLGSRTYAEHPLHSPAKTAAVINLDGNLPPAGPTRDFECIGMGKSSLEDMAAAILRRQHRVLTADTEPEKGYFYRSDHFPFAKEGVPAFYGRPGIDLIGKPPGTGEALRAAYTANDYHNVTDVVKPWWDLGGAEEDVRFFFELGLAVAAGTDWPEWKPGCEFKARRDASASERR